MPDTNLQLKINEAIFEKLRCSLCIGYLSCAPIRLLPDGNNICGYCSPNDDEVTYRQLTLEAILTETEFPCKFKEFGCKTVLQFGHGTNHEDICDFRKFPCNSLSTCEWQGPFMKLPAHYQKDHMELVKEAPYFLFNIESSVKEAMMIIDAHKTTLFIAYEYDPDTFNLNYSIRYFLANVIEATHKIRLINVSDLDYVLQLKGGECFRFDTFKSEEAINLNVNKYLDVLNNPEDIKVEFDFAITVDSGKVDEFNEITVDYDVLEQLRCSGCQYYLIPPIYYVRPKIICADCYKFSAEVGPPAHNWRINDLISMAIYPCRWTDCNFVGKSNVIREHESNCHLRMYRCLVSNCRVSINSKEIVEHLKNHDDSCFYDNKIIYDLDLQDSTDELQVLTFLDKEIILVNCSTKNLNCCENAHTISIISSSFDRQKFKSIVQFGHGHCKLKSKKFFVYNIETVRLSDLPRCFEIDDEIKVYLQIVRNVF